MAKFSVFIPPFADWTTARNTLASVVQKIADYLANLPPPTDLQNSRLSNVGDPVNPKDAVNLQTLQSAVGAGGQSGIPGALVGQSLNPSVALGTIAWKVSVSPWATITAPSGALSLTAGGTNQDLSLTPSGTGNVVTAANVVVDATNGHVPSTKFAWLSLQPGNVGDVLAYDGVGATFLPLQLRGKPVSVLGGGTLGVGTATPGFALDVVGDGNVSGVFRCAGSAGQTVTETYLKSVSNSGTVIFRPSELTPSLVEFS